MRKLSLITLILILTTSTPLAAQYSEQHIIEGDTVAVSYTPIEQSKPRSKKSFKQWIDEHVLRDNSSIEYGSDFSIIGGPSYSTSTNLRLSLIGDIYYRTKTMSLDVEPSRLEIAADVSISGFYRVAIAGHNFLDRGQHRLFYHIETSSQPTKFWGLNYDSSCGDSYGKYTSKRHFLWLRYNYAITRHLYAGLYGDYNYLSANNCDLYTSSALYGETDKVSSAGIGVSLSVDSRNTTVNTQKGVFFTTEYIYRPKFASNVGRNLWELTAQFNFYLSLWKGAILAYDLYGEFRAENTPWLLRSQLGDECRMRGYYEGRYNGNNLISTQLELRQQLWNQLGCVAWVGCGMIFSSWKYFDTNEILPTYGLGIRYRVRGNSNIRLDFGWGRNCFGLVVGINEAF